MELNQMGTKCFSEFWSLKVKVCISGLLLFFLIFSISTNPNATMGRQISRFDLSLSIVFTE